MQKNPNNTEQTPLVACARALGRSRSGQLLGAVLAATFFGGMAWVSWHHRDLAAYILTLWLIIYGQEQVWRLLPIPASMRARWTPVNPPGEEKHPAHRFRGFFWSGLGFFFFQLWYMDPNKRPNWRDFPVPLLFMLAGCVSYIYCGFLARQAGKDRADQECRQ